MKQLFLTIFFLFFTVLLFAQKAKTTSTSSQSSTVSINNSDNNYTLTADFSKDQTDQVKDLIIHALGQPENRSENLSSWSSGAIYNATLKPHHLILDLDKDAATGSLIKTIQRLGAAIQRLLNATDSSAKN